MQRILAIAATATLTLVTAGGCQRDAAPPDTAIDGASSAGRGVTDCGVSPGDVQVEEGVGVLRIGMSVEEVRQRTAGDLRELAHSFGARLAGVETVNHRGEPEDVIPEFAVAQGIDLVVMGTVARSGVAGLLIGNTAERVLRSLPCSVLAVKPDGFKCPVVLDSA